MNKEKMLSDVSDILDVIDTAFKDVDSRIDCPVFNDKVAALGNYSEQELPLVAKLTQFYIANSTEFISKRGKGGGYVRLSWQKQKIVDKNQGKTQVVKSEISKEISSNLESKMISRDSIIDIATKSMSKNPDNIYPLDENESNIDESETDE